MAGPDAYKEVNNNSSNETKESNVDVEQNSITTDEIPTLSIEGEHKISITYNSGDIIFSDKMRDTILNNFDVNKHIFKKLSITINTTNQTISDDKLEEKYNNFMNAISNNNILSKKNGDFWGKTLGKIGINIDIKDPNLTDKDILKKVFFLQGVDNNKKLTLFRAYYIYSQIRGKVGYMRSSNKFSFNLKIVNNSTPTADIEIYIQKLEGF